MTPGEISPYRISVTPGYFEAMGIASLTGRLINDGDTEAAPGVVIADEKLAHRFWEPRVPSADGCSVPTVRRT